jgi:hypothetical protein
VTLEGLKNNDPTTKPRFLLEMSEKFSDLMESLARFGD